MAVVNQYKFYGVTLATTDETTMFDPSDTEKFSFIEHSTMM